MTEAERIGQAILDLAARLPEGYHDLTGVASKEQAQMYVSFDAGDEVWEIEFCALDPGRNFLLQDADPDALLTRALQQDREAAPDV